MKDAKGTLAGVCVVDLTRELADRASSPGQGARLSSPEYSLNAISHARA